MKDIATKCAYNFEIIARESFSYLPNGKHYLHALLPAGKLFRPMLVYSLGLDLNKHFNLGLEQDYLMQEKGKLSYLAAMTELFHVYTLIHDDLPCMDNDDERRGRPSLHKHYGQWQALLAGDALQCQALGLLQKQSPAHIGPLLSLANWCLGAKGLILGQYYDLETDTKPIQDFNHVLKIHELKTARLFQFCLLASSITLSFPANKVDQRKINQLNRDLYRLGHCLGIAFQLMDDHDELKHKQGKELEQESYRNAFSLYPERAEKELEKSIYSCKRILSEYQFTNLKGFLIPFLEQRF